MAARISSPQAAIELFAGLSIAAGGQAIAWRRHPTEIHDFHIDVPEARSELEARFQFLSPTDAEQGRGAVTPDLLNLEWNMVVLYPAGHFARRIVVQPSLILPEGWQLALALELTAKVKGAPASLRRWPGRSGRFPGSRRPLLSPGGAG